MFAVMCSEMPGTNDINSTTPPGNFAVFEARFSRYRRMLRFIATRILGSPERADEAVENTWLSASRNPPWFECNGAFGSWLLRALIDEALEIRGHQEKTNTTTLHSEHATSSPSDLVKVGRNIRRRNKMTETSSIAFKRGPSPDTTLDVFGVDVTFLVENEHTGGRFGVLEYVSKPGHEPPPHWHEHEDEVFCVVEGQFEVHCGDQVLQVGAGECVFLPRGKPHGFIIRTPRLRAICVIEPSGAEQALRILGLPKNGRDRRPAGATYASAMKEPDSPLKVAAQFGVHNLTRDEIAVSMPHFPLPPLT